MLILRNIFFVFVCIMLFFSIFSTTLAAQPNTQSEPQLNEYQKETIASIRDITLQLILIAMGVFAIVGGFVAAENRTYQGRAFIWISFLLLTISVVAGLLTYGNLIWTLGKAKFDPFGPIESLARVQWGAFGLGGIFFVFFVSLNIRRRV